MKKRKLLKSFLLMLFLVTILIFAAEQSAVSEMTLNDNVNIEGDIFLNGTGGGINFPDGSEQRTAASPPWSKTITTGRFEEVLGGYAVLDHETGLVWEKNTSDGTLDWYAAQAYCYPLVLGGRRGWRLPTVDELTTLMFFGDNPELLPSGHPFTNAKKWYYWSSTPAVESNGDTLSAWSVYFTYYGGVIPNLKSTGFYVRAVRSGQ